jgi:hypothetical protein
LFRVRKAKEVDENDLEPTAEPPDDKKEKSHTDDQNIQPQILDQDGKESKDNEELPQQDPSSTGSATEEEERRDEDDEDRPKFKPFFFLDNIIT